MNAARPNSASEATLEFVRALQRDEVWEEIEKLLRRAAQVVASEWKTADAGSAGVKVDVRSLVRELSTSPLNADLQNFFSGNHRFIAMLAEKNRRAAAETYDFVDSIMPKAMFHPRQMDIISSRKQEILQLDGHILDLGVYKGGSTRNLAAIFPQQIIHGFDSFEGLPEDWTHALKGAFGDLKGILPNMPANVRLYKGWFDQTLPLWYQGHKDRPISLLRIDCDIYSSTKTIFDELGSLLRSGSWIVFDELIGYRGFKDHEYKAFSEFVARTGIGFEYVAFGLTYAMGYVK